MGLSRLENLVSQSEREGVTLGELLARKMSSKDLDKLQSRLRSDIEAGYAKIEDFMSDVHITSVWDMVGSEISAHDTLLGSEPVLSDDA